MPRNEAYVHEAYMIMLERYKDGKYFDDIIIKISLSSQEEDAYYMLWDVRNSDKLDFISVIKNTIDLCNWDKYAITSDGCTLHDHEDFCCAVLCYLDGYCIDDNNEPMQVDIREKTPK